MALLPIIWPSYALTCSNGSLACSPDILHENMPFCCMLSRFILSGSMFPLKFYPLACYSVACYPMACCPETCYSMAGCPETCYFRAWYHMACYPVACNRWESTTSCSWAIVLMTYYSRACYLMAWYPLACRMTACGLAGYARLPCNNQTLVDWVIWSWTGVKERTTDFSLIMYTCFLEK